MEDTQKLIEEFKARGGKVQQVPSKHYRRKDFEAETLKKRRMLDDLRKRAEKLGG